MPLSVGIVPNYTRVLQLNYIRSGKTSHKYSYDKLGNVLSMEDSTGTTKYSYDNLSRLVGLDSSNKQTISYTYDANGNQLSVQSGVNHLVKYNYDKMNRMNQVQYDGQSTHYDYDANGNQTKMIHSNGMKSSYTFDGRNLLTGIVNTNPDGTEKKYYYNYDEEGLITKKQEPTGTTTYEYNGNQQLVRMVEPDQRTTDYTYDKAGNRSTQKVQLKDETTEVKYTYNKQNRLTQTVEEKANNTISSNYKYDDNGNQISVSEKDSSTGVTKKDGYAYDEWNQLVQINDRDGKKTDYSYYANGLRATKSDGKSTTDFTYDGTDLLIEKNGEATQTNIYGTSRIATMGSQLVYYQYNNHGDVTGVLDAAGNQKNEYEYDAFGNVTKMKEAFSNPYRYAGYYQDSESNLYYLQSRYYNARTARFLSEDTASGKYTDPLSLNKYTYCHNQPVTGYDPDGHFLNILGGAIIGGLIGAGASIVSQLREKGSIDFRETLGSAAEGAIVGGAAGATGGLGLFFAGAAGNAANQLISKGSLDVGQALVSGAATALGGAGAKLGDSLLKKGGQIAGKFLGTAGKEAAAKAGGSVVQKGLKDCLKTGFKCGVGATAYDITTQVASGKGLTDIDWKEVGTSALAGFGLGMGAKALSNSKIGQKVSSAGESVGKKLSSAGEKIGEKLSTGLESLKENGKALAANNDGFMDYEAMFGKKLTNKLATEGVTQAELPGRNGALNQAKRDAGILRNSKPDYVEHVAMSEPEYAGGHVIKDANGNVIYTREYNYTNSAGEHVVIQEHSAPHIGADGPHFNVRPITDTRHEVFPGTKEHYPFKK